VHFIPFLISSDVVKVF